MRRMVAWTLALACGGGSHAPVHNHVAPVSPEACTDHRSAMRDWMSFVVSDDPRDDHIPYDLVNSTWRAAEPTFVPCFRVYMAAHPEDSLSIGVEFKISEAGVAHAITTWGPDATVDRCVCETIARIAFPHIRPRVLAKLAVGP